MSKNLQSERLVDISSGDDDSDGDIVTDYLQPIINSTNNYHHQHHNANQDVSFFDINLNNKHQQQQYQQKPTKNLTGGGGGGVHHHNIHSNNQLYEIVENISGVGEEGEEEEEEDDEDADQQHKFHQHNPFNLNNNINKTHVTPVGVSSCPSSSFNAQTTASIVQQILPLHLASFTSFTLAGSGSSSSVGATAAAVISNSSNMVPIISVTPHSPGAKYNSILEDSLNQLQNIRESVVQMKNSTVQIQSYTNFGYNHRNSLSSVRLTSCSSLPDLSATGNIINPIWSIQQDCFNADRRKSWTAIEDLTDCTKGSHKSVSLSSLDSEEQESIRAAERLHNRTSRNSTGGISTHSLNEAELARDFERIAAKRNLTPMVICRIPLQKSISTPSIAPIRLPGAKEENNIATSRHLSDSEDDNQDDRSMLCVRDKIEVYDDHPEKRRKRGSLFFRKKKDKTKTKGQSTNCEACGTVINLSTVKEHALECKGKPTKQQSSKSFSNKKNSANSGKKMTGCYSPWRLVANKLGVTSHHASHSSSHHHDDGRDYYDGHNNDHLNYTDETPLLQGEFLSEPPIKAEDLGADPTLRIAQNEHDSWSPGVTKEIVKLLKDKQVKRQEHIYEFIMTEKHHCQTLLVMKKVFVESLQRHFNHLKLDRMFPRLSELIELHTSFLKKLRLKQQENLVVDSIADIIFEFFSLESAKRLKSAYGEFCSNHRSALDTFKDTLTRNPSFAEWHKHCQTNPLLKKKGIPECILFITQRLTKYPLLIDPLLKSSREDKNEQDKLQKAMNLVKSILVDVDRCVAEKEKIDRQLEIFKRIDAKSFSIYRGNQFKKADIGVGTNRKLKFEGYATLMQGRSKMQNVLVVVVSDCLFFLQENSHNKYTFFTPENKAGVVPLQKLLIREKAGTESRGIYIISSNPAFPEMYELKVQNPKDKNAWIQAIRNAVLACHSDDSKADDLTAEEKQKLIDAKQANIRELIYKMRQKDIEQAILLEEKILLQLSLMDRKATSETSPSAEEFLANFGTYRDLITDDCDTVEIWKRVLNTVQDISQLASSLYTAATGLPLARSFSSVGEKHSEAYSSPILPKRAETFGGFDERRNKVSNVPWREAVLSTLPMANAPMPHQHQQHLPIASNIITYFRDNHNNQQQHSSSSSGYLSDKRDSIPSSSATTISEYDTNSNTLSVQQLHHIRKNSENISLKDNNFAALQVSHHLHTLLCIISQQMTTINNLRAQLSQQEIPKYKHNDQLEELRNLQDRLQEEKQSWLKQKEHQELELEEQRKIQEALQKQIKAEQDDVKQQREQLYRKMEKLSSQGYLVSPNTPLPISPAMSSTADSDNHLNSSDEYYYSTLGSDMGTLTDRKKDKWRTASTSKASPGNLLSATNAPKNPANIKQQIPIKLLSLSSTKNDKSPTISSNTIATLPINTGNSSGLAQILPHKLADKNNKQNQTLTPNHSRTGSSPAIIQQPIHQISSGNPAIRTNTYPKLNERYRMRNSDVGLSGSTAITSTLSGQSFQQPKTGGPILVSAHHTRSSPLFTTATTTVTTGSTITNPFTSQLLAQSNSSCISASTSTTTPPVTGQRKNNNQNSEDEEMYV